MKKLIKFIDEKNSLIIPIILVIGILIVIILSVNREIPLGGRSSGGNDEILTEATSNLLSTWTEYPMFSGSVVLNRIAIGKYADGGQVAVYDSTGSFTPDDILFYVTNSAARMWEINVKANTGLIATTTDLNNVMFYYTPD